jgi:hypothetical protein
VGDLAGRLFYTALDEGYTKVYFVIVQLFDQVFSDKMDCRSSVEEIEDELGRREQDISTSSLMTQG